MKNLQELTLRQTELAREMIALSKPVQDIEQSEKNAKLFRKVRHEKHFVDFCVEYLKTNPTEESVCRQLNEQLKKLEIIDARFETWFVNEGYKRPSECQPQLVTKKMAEYNAMMERTNVVRKITMLEFLNPQQSLEV